METKNKKILKFVLILAGIIIVLNIAYFASAGKCPFGRKHFSGGINMLGGGKVAVVNIYGPLYNSKNICESIQRFNNDASIKAIILRIDSPGGGVAVCQEINREIYKARENKKIVVSSFGSVAASGGYYVGCAADYIFTNPGTVTGSLGVIMSYFNFSELFKKLGLEQITIKAGKHKDIGSMSRKMTSEEEALMQGVLDDVHGQFIDTIVRNREAKITKILKGKKGLEKPVTADVRNFIVGIADGRIFSGNQALGLGLVDYLGTQEDAVRFAAERAGLKGEPVIVYEKKKTSFLSLISGSEETEGHLNKFLFKGVCFLYGE